MIIQEKFDFEKLEANSIQWKETENFKIYKYDGQMPKTVVLDEIEEYIFYRHDGDDFAVNNEDSKIYINNQSDTQKVLRQVALDESNNFDDSDLSEIFGDELKKEKEKNAKLEEELRNAREKNGLKGGADSDESEKEESKNHNFAEEVRAFISELEGSEWSSYIPDLKNILQLSVSHPKEKQHLFNLIAKIKLTKTKGIKFEDCDEGFNVVKIGAEKYFVHSARGAFAYIHPMEILKMKQQGYRMALDFNTKSLIKIYETAEEILHLNTNHILAYQYEKTDEELFSFCEANRDANKHLLIIDKNNASEKSKTLLKLLNIDDDYR